MSKNWRNSVALAVLAAAVALPADLAFAQVEELLVTAQRREQNLQTVPAAVSALSPQMLEEKQVLNVLDLQYQIPNLSIATNTGTASGARVFLRGVGEDESRVSADPAIAIYVDNVYIGRQTGALFDLVDLERVEVLRGPQGTLYGRNSNGGAIKLISKQPEDDNSMSVKATFGSDARFDFRGTANMAFTENTAARVTGLIKNRDGFWDVIPNGAKAGTGGEVGEVDTAAIRGAIRHNFNDAWKATLTVDHTNDQSDPVPDSVSPLFDADGDIFTIEPLPPTVCGAASTSIGCFTAYDSEVISTGAALAVEGDLGGYTFNSITGYRQLDDDLASRVGSPYFQKTDQDQWSQEVTLTSNYEGPFNFVVGAFYFTEDARLDTNFIFDFRLDIETHSYAVFGHGTYDLTDALTLTAGLRFTDETKDIDADNITSAALTPVVESRSFENWTYNAALDYQWTDDVMTYVSYATGTKSGGWSPDCFGPTACFLPVDEEELSTIELGLRSDLFDNMLQFNATYFFNKYDGLQIAGTVPGLGFTRFNVDETEIQGAEIEAIFSPLDNLDFNFTFGWLDGEYTSVTAGQASALTNAGAACPGGVSSIACAKDLELKNAPEYKGTVGVVYRLPLYGGELAIGGDVNFEDESWNLVANSPASALTDPGTLYNARIAFTPESERWQVAVWGRNLSDEEYSRASTAGSFSVYASPPLEWGVDLSVNF